LAFSGRHGPYEKATALVISRNTGPVVATAFRRSAAEPMNVLVNGVIVTRFGQRLRAGFSESYHAQIVSCTTGFRRSCVQKMGTARRNQDHTLRCVAGDFAGSSK
jgi:hypothetical protein